MMGSFVSSFADRTARVRGVVPGLAVAGLVAICGQFLSEHYGAPAMLMALLVGMALNFLSEEGAQTAAGLDVAAKTVLRVGVALLGARISVDMLADLGWAIIGLVLAGVGLTIVLGILGARLVGRDWAFGLLSGGSVAICGASAALAIAAVLPAREQGERDLLFTVLAVTILSTMAMICYPMISAWLGLDPRLAGAFLGGTIHDVAQVVGAGFSMGQETGEVATLVKLLRVSALAPVVLIAGALIGRRMGRSGARQPILPGFVIGFLCLAVINSTIGFPQWAADAVGGTSRAALLMAIAAVGAKTSLRRMVEVGPRAITLIMGETLFLAGFILIGLSVIG